MDMMQVVGLGLFVTILIMVIKEQKPMFAFLLSTFTCVFIFLFLIGKISAVIRAFEDLAQFAGINTIFLKTILKIMGIAYIAEFGAQIVRDAGQESIAAKIELSGKIMIMVMAIPIITVIVQSVVTMLPA
jgi:stage III sporulation protein AD